MKRILCSLVIVGLVPFFVACTSIKGDGIHYFDEAVPYTVTVYMQFELENMSTIEFGNLLRENWIGEATISADTENYIDNGDGTVTVNLDIKVPNGVKQETSEISTDLLYRHRTITMFSPLTMLNKIEGVVYAFGIQTETRHSAVENAIELHLETGEYQYLWYANAPNFVDWDWQNSDIVVYDKFANQPTWYIIAVILSAFTGIIVYFVCKKPQNKDIIE